MNDLTTMRKIGKRMKKVEELFDASEKAMEECSLPDMEIIPAVSDTEITEVTEDSSLKLFEMNELRSDFLLSRQNLQALLSRCQSLMEQVPKLDINDMKASQIDAIASLSNAITTQLQLMTSSYKVLAEIENLRNPTPKGVNVGKTEIQNQAVFVGSNSELLKLLKENG